MLYPDPNHRGENTMTDTTICSVDGCDKPSRSKGMCPRHYQRVKRHGNPNTLLMPLAERGAPRAWLMDHLSHKGEDCLKWPFATRKVGYGVLSKIDSNTMVGAHREMCRLAHGEPPTAKHEAAHSCGKGHEGCVNPCHLSWKTPTENGQDKIAHGTSRRGSKSPHTKLTDEDVSIIRGMKGIMLQRELAEVYGVSRECISHIQRGSTWG